MDIASIDGREIERRKDRLRRAWQRKKVDHTPLAFVLEDFHGRTLREACGSGEIQLAANRANIDRLLRILPDDYIPVARLWPGYVTIATMFGHPRPLERGSQPGAGRGGAPRLHPEQAMPRCSTARPPDPRTSGLMPFILTWTAALRARASSRGLDRRPRPGRADEHGKGPLPNRPAFHGAVRLSPSFSRGSSRSPRRCRRPATGRSSGQPAASSGSPASTSIPCGRRRAGKGSSRTTCARGFPPTHFRKFSMPANNRIFREWHGGRIHNCGPHPAAGAYLDHDPPIDGLNCSFRYTRRGSAKPCPCICGARPCRADVRQRREPRRHRGGVRGGGGHPRP